METVKILLDWTYDAKHAVLVEGRDKGFFKEAGIDLEIIEPASKSAMAIERLYSGDAELAINYPHNILLMQKDYPGIISVGTLVGSNPEGLLSLEKTKIYVPSDLLGKTIGVGPSPVSLAQLEMFLKANSISEDSVTLKKVGFEGEELLIKGEIDALDAVSYAIPRTLNKGFKVNFIGYTQNGLPDSPFLVFAAAEAWAKEHKELLKGFFIALSKGLSAVEAWSAADWTQFTNKIPGRNAPEEQAVWDLILPAIANGKAFNHDQTGLKSLMDILLLKGILKNEFDLDRFFSNSYL
jgi:putative hydroxymethylpyrimidine transport system substrate-binding protein